MDDNTAPGAGTSTGNVIDLNQARRQDGIIAELKATALANASPEASGAEIGFETKVPQPNIADASTHLYQLFPPSFVHGFPNSEIEIVYGEPGDFRWSRWFSAFDIETIVRFIEVRVDLGDCIYVGAGLRHGPVPDKGRANITNFEAASCAWIEYDSAGDHERVAKLCAEKKLEPLMIVRTGTVPCIREHVYFRLAEPIRDAQKLKAVNDALCKLFSSDDVKDAARILRLAGCINTPKPDKRNKGYVPEVVTLKVAPNAKAYTAEQLGLVDPGKSEPRDPFDLNDAPTQEEMRRRDADDLFALLQESRTPGKWHNSMLAATASMVGKGWTDAQIRVACAAFCNGGVNDPDLDPLIDGARKKFNKPEPDFLDNKENDIQEVEAAPSNLILSSAEFLKGFAPPDYLIVGLLQRRFIYSFTGLTGSAKTAIALLWAAHVALGKPIGDYDVEQGRVLFLAGENPDDIRMRWMAMAEFHGFDANNIDVHFLPGVYKLTTIGGRLWDEVQRLDPISLVIVDTSAVYFEGDEENNNVQMITHAHRLRDLVMLPGSPCVLVCCHPIKNATSDNMLPRGGGAFLNELDGNLISIKADAVAKVHWCGKFRGPDFSPVPFGLTSTTAKGLVDSKGRAIMTVVASALSEEAAQKAENAARTDENQVLVNLRKSSLSVVSLTELAMWCGWRTKDGKSNKSRAQRAAERLKRAKLVEATRGGFSLTPKGRREAEKME